MIIADQKRSIAVVSGGGAQNIGNAFFNVGGLHVVKQMFPDRNVQLIQDQPGYWTFNRSRKNPRNYCQLLSKLDVDYIVLQGPVFSATLPKLWEETLDRLYTNGTQVIYLSSAFFKYTQSEVDTTKAFLEKYPPALISTRDSTTYNELKGICNYVYDGICSAWFVPDTYHPIPIGPERFITFNFDRMPEPNIRIDSLFDQHYAEFSYFDHQWALTMPLFQNACSKRGKAHAYIGAALDFRSLPRKILEYDVMRPEHRTNPHFSWKIYGQPGGIASDEPYTYFNIYANTNLTLSDRVHACVMTLAYGNPAMLFSLSPRSKLFDRLGLDNIRKRPVTVDMKYLENEKSNQVVYLRKTAIELSE